MRGLEMVYQLARASTRWQEEVAHLSCLLIFPESKIAVDLSGILKNSCHLGSANHCSPSPNATKPCGDLPLFLPLSDTDMPGSWENRQPNMPWPTSTPAQHPPSRPGPLGSQSVEHERQTTLTLLPPSFGVRALDVRWKAAESEDCPCPGIGSCCNWKQTGYLGR